MKRHKLIIPFILLSLLLACGRKEYTEQGILEIKNEIDSLLRKPDAEEHFDWGSAKAYSNFSAYYHNSELIFINEDYKYRKPGDSFNLYYFKDGNMLYFIGRAMTPKPGKQLKTIELLVDPDGNVIAYDKVINGKREGLSSHEADQIIDHAGELEDLVYKRSAIVKK